MLLGLLLGLLLLGLLQLPADSESDGLNGGLLAQAAVAPPLAMRRQLAIDPSFEVRGLRISPYNVTKEPASPLIAPSEPWEVTLGYTSVVYAMDQKPPKFIMYWGGAMCCSKPVAECCNGSSSTAVAQAECAAKMIRCRAPPAQPPPLEQVAGYIALRDYIGSSDIGGAGCVSGHDCVRNAVAVCSSHQNCSAFGVYKDKMYQLYDSTGTRHAYPLGKGWNSWRKHGSTAPPTRPCCQPCATCPTTPSPPPSPTGSGSDWPVDATFVAESTDGVNFTRPNLNQVTYGGISAGNVLQMNESRGLDALPYAEIPIADGNRNVMRDDAVTDPACRYKMVGNWQRNDSIIPGTDKCEAGFGCTKPGRPADSWKGYHYGTACSPDGIHWHGYDDITMQVYARADTLNNVVYDKDSKEYMIFTRIDCVYPPFVDGPSLTNCSHDGQGIRRSARSTSKTFGAGSSWSKATDCSTGAQGDEQYYLTPFREDDWAAGLYLGFASYLKPGGMVPDELLASKNYGKSWTRLNRGTNFVPFGQLLPMDDGNSIHGWDSHGIYLGPPVPDPHDPERMLLYYRGSDGPHGDGHSRIGLAYSPRIPAGMAGVGTLHAPKLLVASRVLWVECDDDAAATMEVEISVVGKATHSARLLVEPKQGDGRRHLLETSLPEAAVGAEASLVFHLRGGTLFSFGWQS
jgi:hypothetical protein